MKLIEIAIPRPRIVPTKRKFENAQRFLQAALGESGLSKGGFVDKKTNVIPMSNEFKRIKDSICAFIERMRGF